MVTSPKQRGGAARMKCNCAHKLTSNMCLAGTFSLVCTFIFGSGMVRRGLTCNRCVMPTSCAQFESTPPADEFFELRNGEVTTQLKIAGAAQLLDGLTSVPGYVQPSSHLAPAAPAVELAEFNARAQAYRPAYAYTYTPCSDSPGSPLSRFHRKVTNPTCEAIGCSASDCLEARFVCNMAEGLPQADTYPTLECVKPISLSEIGDWQFALCFLACLVSVGLCALGCCAPAGDWEDPNMVKVMP